MITGDDLTKQLKDSRSKFGINLVDVNTAAKVAGQTHSQLSALHTELSSKNLHPGLVTARGHLATAKEHLERYHQLTGPAHSKARVSLETAGRSLIAAHKALSEVSPMAAAEIGVDHTINGKHVRFTPGSELAHITKNPQPPSRAQAPKKVRVGGTVVPTGAIEAVLDEAKAAKEQGVPGTETIRPEVEAELRRRIAPTPKRSAGRIGPEQDPKQITTPLAERLGSAAVEPSKVGDWGGSEQAAPVPGSPLSRVDEMHLGINVGQPITRIARTFDPLKVPKESLDESGILKPMAQLAKERKETRGKK